MALGDIDLAVNVLHHEFHLVPDSPDMGIGSKVEFDEGCSPVLNLLHILEDEGARAEGGIVFSQNRDE